MAALVLLVVTLTAAGVCVLLGELLVALMAIGVGVLFMILFGIICQQHNAASIASPLRGHGERLKYLERIVSRAEWRCGEQSRQLGTQMRNIRAPEHFQTIESTLHDMARQRRLEPANDGYPNPNGRISEEDLEMFLVQLLAQRHDGPQ